jgi:Tfp pilus assembly protein PilO
MFKAIIAIVLFAISGAIFFMYTKQTYDNTISVQGQIVSYDAALQKANELQQLKQTLLQRYNSFNPTDLDRLQKLLPDHVDNIALMMDLDNLANHYNMVLENVAVSAPSGGSSETSVGVIGQGDRQKYDSLTISFSTQGTYDHFQTFLKGLESSLRVVDMVTLSLSAGGKESTTSTEPVYTYGLTIRTYWLK